MKSNYKKLGKYIREVDERNRDLKIEKLLGVSISKMFIPSIANTIGTDFSNYKIARRGQFAYGPVTSRNGDKVSIALLDEDDCIISSSYTVFEIIDTNELLPEYLMMWFRRPEFDRYARYMSHGSVRELFGWNELCGVELPVPDITEQQKIVDEYNVLCRRITLNEQMNQKLEETAQAIYKQWFVDFEFPDENGQPYKSSGGEFEESELGDIPKNWDVGYLGNAIQLFDSKRVPLSNAERIGMQKLYPYYGAASLMDYVDNYIFDGTYVLLGEDGSVMNENGSPVLQYVWGKFWVNNHAHIISGNNGFNSNSIYILLNNINVSSIVTGGVQAKISQTNLNSIKISLPPHNLIEIFNTLINPIFEFKKRIMKSCEYCNSMANLLLSSLA